MLRNLIVGFMSAICLAGCASGPAFNTVQNNFASLKSDQARIYFYRSSSFGGALQPEIRLNGKVVGKAEPNGIFFVDCNPGNMEVTTSTEVEKKLTFTVEAGEKRYVRTNASLGLLVARIIPELVSAEEAKEEIADLAYTGGNNAEK